ncbi:hypothetical protein DFH11DRAFT_1725711 [Phellopilus nigrolimitatus]|nr:hypothetical protein DFH11DRAFT_1725711 [Phellopilus nigrolimitatus]
MPNDSIHSETLLFLIDLSIIVCIVAFFAILYKHKGNRLKRLESVVCISSPAFSKETVPWRLGPGKARTAASDLEKSQPALAADRPVDGATLARVLSYLYNLPRQSIAFMTIKERPLWGRKEAQASLKNGEVNEEAGSVWNLARWTEVINAFPRPPDAAHFRSDLEANNLKSPDSIVNGKDNAVSSERVDDAVSASCQPRPAHEISHSLRNIKAPITSISGVQRASTLACLPKARFWPKPCGNRSACNSWIPSPVQYVGSPYLPRPLSRLSVPTVTIAVAESEKRNAEYVYW